MPVTEVANSRLEPVAVDWTDRAFVLHNPALEEILLNRNLVGLPFTRACEEASVNFFRHFEPEIEVWGDDVAELMLLSKGMYYWFHNAFARVFERNLELNLAVTSRVEAHGSFARVEVRHASFEAPASNLVIGDTVASGASVIAVLERYMQDHPLKRVLLFAIAGSAVGGQAITSFCRRRGIDVTLVYGLALFGLASNGFDLSFLHPDTVTALQYRERSADIFRGKPVSAVGWDFGSQAQSLRKYRALCWLEAEYWGLQDANAFRQKERPIDRRLISKEYSAYRDRFPDSPTS